MILILRGHIRSSFNDNKLYFLIKEIYENNPELEIYISTFDIIQSKISWRKMPEILTPVTDETIYNYFNDLSFLIKKILIINENEIKIIENTDGYVCKTKAPLIGWKRYWYCKYEILKYIHSIKKEYNIFVINCRFDIFCNSNNFFNKDKIIKLIEDNINNKFIKNKFIIDDYRNGIDNIYIGNIVTQFKLSSHFMFNMDNIIRKNLNITHQEILVYLENDNLHLIDNIKNIKFNLIN
jgi:hypothetical protein